MFSLAERVPTMRILPIAENNRSRLEFGGKTNRTIDGKYMQFSYIYMLPQKEKCVLSKFYNLHRIDHLTFKSSYAS